MGKTCRLQDDMSNSYQILVGKREEKKNITNEGIDKRIILKLI